MNNNLTEIENEGQKEFFEESWCLKIALSSVIVIGAVLLRKLVDWFLLPP